MNTFYSEGQKDHIKQTNGRRDRDIVMVESPPPLGERRKRDITAGAGVDSLPSGAGNKP